MSQVRFRSRPAASGDDGFTFSISEDGQVFTLVFGGFQAVVNAGSRRRWRGRSRWCCRWMAAKTASHPLCDQRGRGDGRGHQRDGGVERQRPEQRRAVPCRCRSVVRARTDLRGRTNVLAAVLLVRARRLLGPQLVAISTTSSGSTHPPDREVRSYPMWFWALD